jgi:hypothetical protein
MHETLAPDLPLNCSFGVLLVLNKVEGGPIEACHAFPYRGISLSSKHANGEECLCSYLGSYVAASM